MCIFRKLYRGLPKVEQRFAKPRAMAWSRSAVSELQLAVALAPAMASSINADVAPLLLASDASTTGEAVVRAPLPRAIGREVWRLRERRGHYTWLCGKETEHLFLPPSHVGKNFLLATSKHPPPLWSGCLDPPLYLDKVEGTSQKSRFRALFHPLGHL